LRYTTDGSDPTQASPLYTGVVTLTSPTTLRVRSFEAGFDPSSVASAVFDVQPGSAPQITNSIPTTAQLGETFVHLAQATGLPAPQFSLDAAPAGMTVNASTGEFFWVPNDSGDVTVTLRASNGRAPDGIQSVTVSVGNFLAAADPDPGLLTQGGLRFSYFEDGETARTAGVTPVPSVGIRERDDFFRIRFEGFIEVPLTGDYQLLAATGDEAKILIGGTDVTGQTVGLAAGLHELVVDYAEQEGAQDLQLRWSGPSIPEQAVPSSALRYFTVPYGIFMRPQAAPYLGTFPPDETGAVPTLLSATGAFENHSTLEIADGFVPYEPNAKLWSDGADKLRWISVPTGTSIDFAETGAWAYPAGTVFIKHFEIGDEKRRIETRFEIIKADGSPYLVTYKWLPDQSDAVLVGAAGESAPVIYDGKQIQWDFPSQAQCSSCHNSSVKYVLGSSTRQLNGDHGFPSGVMDNQLRTWSHLGLFSAPPAEVSLPGLDKLSELADTAAPLEHRVRSYLDSNCANCHNSTAAPEGTNFVFDFDTPLSAANVIGGGVANDLGLGVGARIVASRDPKHSVLYQRLAGNDPATRMPPVGRAIVHREARELLVDWILSLPPANTFVDVTDYSRRWDFDGTTGDGTWRDTANAPTYAAGQIGQALEFDGADDAVDLGPLDVPSGDGLTITFWFKADDFGTHDARFLSKADGQFDDDHFWMVSSLDGTKLRFRLRSGGSTSNLISSAGVLSTGEWTHVAARYDGMHMELYVNGVMIASQPKTGVLDTSGTVDAAIGNQPTTASGGARPFDGLMDDVRIYPRALSSEEIGIVRDAGGTLNSAPSVQLPPSPDAVGQGNFLTRAGAAKLDATATDGEDGDISGGITWFSPQTGDAPAPADLPDGAHTLIATARDSNGSADSALLRINIVPGFEGWAMDLGLPDTPEVDLDGDGFSLLEEYAFGLLPGFSVASPITMTFDEAMDALTLAFPVRPEAIDVRYEIQFSDDLDVFTSAGEWIPLGDVFGGDSTDSIIQEGGGFEVRATSPAADAERSFGRVRITKP